MNPIKTNVYYYVDDVTGKKVFDTEEMRREFEEKLSALESESEREPSPFPFEEGDQDKLQEDVLQVTDAELAYWKKRGVEPNYIYDLAEEGWEKKLGLFETVG